MTKEEAKEWAKEFVKKYGYLTPPGKKTLVVKSIGFGEGACCNWCPGYIVLYGDNPDSYILARACYYDDIKVGDTIEYYVSRREYIPKCKRDKWGYIIEENNEQG